MWWMVNAHASTIRVENERVESEKEHRDMPLGCGMGSPL
jgi:hypothetical protein